MTLDADAPVADTSAVDTVHHGVVDEVRALTVDEARTLTEQIRSTGEVLMTLLARAHAGRAWLALGYGTFEDYVRTEFDISRSRAYQLLDAGRVRAAIEAVAPEGVTFELTEAAARDLKTIVGEVAGVVEDRTAGMRPDEAGDVVEEIIAEHREQVRQQREIDEQERAEQEEDRRQRQGNADYGDGGGYQPPPPPPPVEQDDGIDPKILRRNVQAAYDLYTSITALRSMPDAAEIVGVIPAERRFQINESLRPALDWLTAFLHRWEAQPWQIEAAEMAADD